MIETRERLLAELAEVQAVIDRAYWTFTRTANGKPPVLQVPEAYARRREIRAQLRAGLDTPPAGDQAPSRA